jgi:leucyl/phenylalanyl-tRNA--protein transferase
VTPRIPPAILLDAYASGWFPMGNEAGGVDWYSPDPRGIVPLDGVHIPRRLARRVRQGRFTVHVDRAFRRTIESCAARGDTWITAAIVESYVALHEAGHAHSVETWRGDQLVGGLYGVALGGAFFGESMFHEVTDASKIAFHALVERLRARSFLLLDVQWVTEHLAQFGAIEISRARYLELLADSLRVRCQFG